MIYPFLFMIKGGWLRRIRSWVAIEDKVQTAYKEQLLLLKHSPHWSSYIKIPFHAIAKWALDGTNLSALLFFAFSCFFLPTGQSFALAGVWWFFAMWSMGEEAGAAGDYNGGWGEYIDNGFGRAYGLKKGMIYGIAGGGMLTAVTGNWFLIVAGASFPLAYFLGSSLHLLIHKERSWGYAEPLYGLFFTFAALAGGQWI